MLFTNLIPQETLKAEIESGRISVRRHPTLPLSVYNYTPKAQYDGHTDATRICRGIVVDDNGTLVARPLPKFYNHNESSAPVFTADDPVYVMDKADGSLIIAFNYDGRFVCCTRGSFESKQAYSAQKILDSVSFDWDDYTYLFEYVGPDNRIVLSYEESELIFLGAMDTESGRHILPDELATPFKSVDTFSYETFGAALAAPARSNAEGLVLVGAPGIVKIKQEDYIRIHRLVSGLTAKSIWQHLVNGGTLDELKRDLPEEFHSFIEEDGVQIDLEASREFSKAYRAAMALENSLGYPIIGNDKSSSVNRKEVALAIQKDYPDLAKYLFAILDRKPVYPLALRSVKPKRDSCPAWQE